MTPDELHKTLTDIMPLADEIVITKVVYDQKTSGTFDFTAKFSDGGWLTCEGAKWQKK